MDRGWGLEKGNGFAQLMVVVIVGMSVEAMGAMPDSGEFRVAMPLALSIPEKRDMKFRPKGAVLKKAVIQLGDVVSSHLGVWKELEEVTKGNPELQGLRDEAAITMIGSKANNTLQTYLPYAAKWA